jgi:branched-chain amino acid transport system permease protein
LEYIIAGLTLGASYALIAVGYTMVYGIIQLINFAHGEIYMFGAYFAFAMILKAPPSQSIPLACFTFLLLLIPSFVFLKDKFRYSTALLFSCPFCLLMSVGAYYIYRCHVSFFIAFILSIILTSCLGMSIEFVAYRPLRHAPRLAALITAIGMSLCLQNISRLIFSARTRVYPSAFIPDILKVPIIDDAMLSGMTFIELLTKAHRIKISSGVYVTLLQVIIIGVAVGLMVALHLVIRRTKLGKAMRACSQDKITSSLMGIDIDRIILYTFAIGSGMGAVAGMLHVLEYSNLSPTMGYYAGVVAFAAAVLGGIGNIPGAMIGGFVLGIVQSLTGWAEPFCPGISKWTFGIAYAVMIGVILLKPEGILGRATTRTRV